MGKRRERRMLPYRDGFINVVTFNTHVGMASKAGAWRWVKRQTPRLHIVLVQEDERRWARALTRAAFPAPVWARIGPTGNQEGGTYIFARRRRFSVGRRHVPVLTPRLGKGRPARRLTAAYLYDRRTRRNIVVTSAHTWHTAGKSLAQRNDPAIRGHVYQIEEYADWHGRHDDPNLIHISGGDWNRRVSAPITEGNRGQHVVALMGRAGLWPTYTRGGGGARLDEIFVNSPDFIRVARRMVLRLPMKVADHPAVFVSLKVKGG